MSIARANMPKSGNATSAKIGHLLPHAACDRCRAQKLRCVKDASNMSCVRCQASHSDCIHSLQGRPGRPRASGYGSPAASRSTDIDVGMRRESSQLSPLRTQSSLVEPLLSSSTSSTPSSSTLPSTESNQGLETLVDRFPASGNYFDIQSPRELEDCGQPITSEASGQLEPGDPDQSQCHLYKDRLDSQFSATWQGFTNITACELGGTISHFDNLVSNHTETATPLQADCREGAHQRSLSSSTTTHGDGEAENPSSVANTECSSSAKQRQQRGAQYVAQFCWQLSSQSSLLEHNDADLEQLASRILAVTTNFNNLLKSLRKPREDSSESELPTTASTNQTPEWPGHVIASEINKMKSNSGISLVPQHVMPVSMMESGDFNVSHADVSASLSPFNQSNHVCTTKCNTSTLPGPEVGSSVALDTASILQLISCYLRLVSAHANLYSCIYSSLLEYATGRNNQRNRLCPIFRDMSIGGFSLDAFPTIQWRMLLQICLHCLSQSEILLGVPENTRTLYLCFQRKDVRQQACLNPPQTGLLDNGAGQLLLQASLLQEQHQRPSETQQSRDKRSRESIVVLVTRITSILDQLIDMQP